jgi:hypothetical protein
MFNIERVKYCPAKHSAATHGTNVRLSHKERWTSGGEAAVIFT